MVKSTTLNNKCEIYDTSSRHGYRAANFWRRWYGAGGRLGSLFFTVRARTKHFSNMTHYILTFTNKRNEQQIESVYASTLEHAHKTARAIIRVNTRTNGNEYTLIEQSTTTNGNEHPNR